MQPTGVRVLLIDDQPLIAAGVEKMIHQDSSISFCYCQNALEAIDQALAFQPTVILQDLVMPEMDGLTLVKYLRANEKTKMIPLIVLSSKEEPEIKAQAFALGANDYLVKLPDQVELLARIHYHSQSYTHLLERNEAYKKLSLSQSHLQKELDEAAQYVQGLLPPPLDLPYLKTEWEFIPSTSLGGDAFGYEWIDEGVLAVYLLDVCGHGVGAALLSISIINALRGQTLPFTDFFTPSEVLRSLNDAFPMQEHREMFFTIFYATIDFTTNTLAYASGGHPPQFLFQGEAANNLSLTSLKTEGIAIGVVPSARFETKSVPLENVNHLFLFSDGTFEHKLSGKDEMFTFEAFKELFPSLLQQATPPLQAIKEATISLAGPPPFPDDYSVLALSFSKGNLESFNT